MTVIAATLAGVLFVLAVGLRLMSPGKPAPVNDAMGKPLDSSLSEKIRVEINGSRQGMFIKSADGKNPVLLYLHGGMPDYFLSGKYPTGLERSFTVAWWEQRGAGLSHLAARRSETVTMEGMIKDVLSVTRYLSERFRQPKIYLMGHSGGTFVGIQAVALAAEQYHAYIGVAQMSYQLESERLAYEHMLREFRARGDARAVKRLMAAPVTLLGGTPAGYLAFRDEGMHRLGIGTMHNMRSLVRGLVVSSFQFPEYTWTEKVNLWRAKSRSGISILWNDMVATDLRQRVREFKTPIYLLHGRYDYTVNYALARSYFDAIQAPLKGFYTFESSAHSPMFEEPDRMNRILSEDVLMGRNRLADREG